MLFFRQILVLCTVFNYLDCGGPPSPCPSVFKYHFNGTKWQGIVTIKEIQSVTLKLNVELTIAAILPTKYSGEIRLVQPEESMFKSLKDKGMLNYEVLFPLTFPLPAVTLITLNDLRLCSGPPVKGSFVTSISLEHTLFLKSLSLSSNPTPPETFPRLSPPSPPPVSIFPSIKFRPAPTDEPSIAAPMEEPSVEQIECGATWGRSQPLVVSGKRSERGDHPWHVALFVTTDLGISFMCGGSLISRRHVLTAAHCISLASEGREVKPEDFLLMLGKYKIKKFNEPGSVIAELTRIDLHPDYSLDTADADLAILTMEKEVKFTNFIRPICLYQTRQKLEGLVGKAGIISGWGRDELGNKMTNRIRDTEVKIVSQETCLRSHMAFKDITSRRTFCAGGEKEGSGPCTGDSGGGVIIQENGRWFLRGIISRSLVGKNDNLGCDTFSYSVFVDVTKFTVWINSCLK